MNRVTVTATNLSMIEGLTHISISIEGEGGLPAAINLQRELSSDPRFSQVGGVFNPTHDECYLYTFVQAATPSAAVEHAVSVIGLTKH